MSTERKRLYRAELGTLVDATGGFVIYTWFGVLTECGQWVEKGPMRWRRDDGVWHETAVAARAALADRIEAIALACNKQARRLRFAVAEEVAT